MTHALTSGLALDHLDRTVRPQDDLFRFVNGTWLETTEIPGDRARYGTFDILREQSLSRVHDIIGEAAADESAPEGSPRRKVGDLFRSFADTERIEAAGLDPLRPLLADVATVVDVDTLVGVMGRLHRLGIHGVLGTWVGPDESSPEDYVVYLEQGGLGLPDESYYREEKYADIRTAYVAHIERMLTLAGIPEPAEKAHEVMALERRLAASHWDNVTNRDAVKTFNPYTMAEVETLVPEFPWAAWTSAMDAPSGAFDRVIVRQPSFAAAMGETLREVDLEAWRAWLVWHVISTMAPLLPEALVLEDFDFYGRTLSGQPEIKERWKRGVEVVESALGEAVGELYAAKWFPREAKERMQQLVANLVEAFRRSFRSLEWMGEQTRAEAVAKLDRFTPKIGYPDVWRDYSSLEVDAGDLVGNVTRAAAFEHDRNLAKVGTPIDRTEWFMLPQTVNAYYMPSMNEVVFPAAILQPPFFDMEADDAVNYGGIGAVIGHELGHGFDDQGSRYDGSGALRDWWTEEDRERFDALAARLIKQFDTYTPTGLDESHKVSGGLTVGENIGDLGGLQIGYAAYRIATEESGMPEIDGFTGPQRFFMGWAQVWKGKARKEEAIRLLAIDPHAPQELRANAVRNVSEFHEAFAVKAEDELWLDEEERVRIF